MITAQMIIRNAMALAASMSTCQAGPCSVEIDRVQARIDAKLEARAAGGPLARESTAALLHRQPTPGSIAAAEEQLGEFSDEAVSTVAQGMERARAAESAGDTQACERALSDVERVIGP